MKKLIAGIVLASSMSLTGCALAPGGIAADGHVVIAKNNGFLFGLFNKVYVCNVTPGGVTGCQAAETP
jgi:hypothetical protein